MQQPSSETIARRVRLSTKSILAALIVTMAAGLAVIATVEKRSNGGYATVHEPEPGAAPTSRPHEAELTPAAAEARDQRLRLDEPTN